MANKRGRKSRDRSARPSSAPRKIVVPPILTATQRLLRALEEFEHAADVHDSSEPDLRLPDLLDSLSRCSGGAATEFAELQVAYDLIEGKVPVAPSGPKGIHWRAPLSPGELIYYADIATDADTDYRAQRKLIAAAAAQRAAVRRVELDHQCGRPTKTNGTPCANRPVYFPGAGHGGGLGCSRHLTPQEREVMTGLFRDAVTHHDCPGCVATQGNPCFTDGEDPRRLRSVDGAWPTKKAFDGEEVHTTRLDLVKVLAAAF